MSPIYVDADLGKGRTVDCLSVISGQRDISSPKVRLRIKVTYIETSISPSFILYKEVTRPASTSRSFIQHKYISQILCVNVKSKWVSHSDQWLRPLQPLQDLLHSPPRFYPQPCTLTSKSHTREYANSLISVSSDTAISITFGLISVSISLLGVWISYLTLRAMRLDTCT
jgi:hypothetical protein